MQQILLSPPVAFIVFLAFLFLLSGLLSKLAFRSQKQQKEGTGKSYACGEDIPDHLAQPDYSQFFPYAFFFTIAHVACLMVTTVPAATVKIMVMAMVYICVVIIGLYVLLRK